MSLAVKRAMENYKLKVLPKRQGLLIYPTATSTQMDSDKWFSSTVALTI